MTHHQSKLFIVVHRRRIIRTLGNSAYPTGGLDYRPSPAWKYPSRPTSGRSCRASSRASRPFAASPGHLNIGLTGHQTDKAFAHDLMVVGKQQTLPSLKTEPASFLSISALPPRPIEPDEIWKS